MYDVNLLSDKFSANNNLCKYLTQRCGLDRS